MSETEQLLTGKITSVERQLARVTGQAKTEIRKAYLALDSLQEDLENGRPVHSTASVAGDLHVVSDVNKLQRLLAERTALHDQLADLNELLKAVRVDEKASRDEKIKMIIEHENEIASGS